MKKQFQKLMSIFLASSILIAGGSVFLNSSAEAAVKKPTLDDNYAKNAISKKVCNHTTIKLTAVNTRTEEHGELKEIDGQIQILLSMKKGAYNHVHKQTVVVKENMSNLSGGVQDATYTKNGSKIVTGSSKQNYTTKQSTSKTTWAGTYQSTTTAKTKITKQYNCSYCHMRMSAQGDNVVLKTKCCEDTVKINIHTGEIYVYKKGKTVPSKDVGSFLTSVDFLPSRVSEGETICSHTKVRKGNIAFVAEYVNNNMKNVSGIAEVSVDTKKGTYEHLHAQAWLFEGTTFTKSFLGAAMTETTWTKNGNSKATGVGEFICKNGKCVKSVYKSATQNSKGKVTEKEYVLSSQWKCGNCKMRRSSSGQTAIITTKCCGDTIKINLRTGKVTVV